MKFLLLLVAAAVASGQITAPYRPKPVPPVNFEDSPRIHDLLRAGNLYLSLSDAIALALENNLDVEFERFSRGIANSDVLRARGGGTLRGISLSVTEVPPGVGGPATPLLNAPASGNLPGSTVTTSITELNAITPGQSGIAIAGAAGLSPGPPIPPFDPSLTGLLQWQRQTQPETNILQTGTPSLVNRTVMDNLGWQQGFSTGAVVGLNFGATQQNTNSPVSRLNPYSSSTLALNFTQPLLRGFGPAVNRRFIRIAKNNDKTMDLVFRQQAIATVAGVIRLYDDLVSLIEDVKVKEQTLALARRLYEDNRIQVEQGTLAPIELIRAEAGVAAARQDLANSQGFEEQQELIVKTILTRRGTADPAIRVARVIPTDPIDVSIQEPVRPIEDLLADAFRNRPELEEAHLQLRNAEISLEGSRNELLPELNLIASAQNAGLAGQPNALAANGGNSFLTSNQGNIGGLGTGLSQIVNGRYPSYSIGLQVILPLRNRIARADVVRDELEQRQEQVRYQQLENQVRLELEGAVIALARSRAAYEAAVDARRLQERSLAIEMEKYATGLSTNFLVMQYQGFVAQARSTEVAARGVYAQARTALERAIGQTLENHNIRIEDVYDGRISRPAR